MSFTDLGYGPVTLALMESALEEALREAHARGLVREPTDDSRATMASAISEAAKSGDRCSQRLKALALEAIGRSGDGN